MSLNCKIIIPSLKRINAYSFHAFRLISKQFRGWSRPRLLTTLTYVHWSLVCSQNTGKYLVALGRTFDGTNDSLSGLMAISSVLQIELGNPF